MKQVSAKNRTDDMIEMTLVERAEAAKERIESECVPSLYGEAGADGMFAPTNDTEMAFSRYWTDDRYSWDDMVGDISADAIMDGEADAIMDGRCKDLRDAVAACKEDDDLRDAAITHIRERMREADCDENTGVRQAACDAVTWTDVSGDVLDFLRGDLAAEDLEESDVIELEQIAPAE